MKGCMCAECKWAKSTEDPELIICDNISADDYGMKLFAGFDSCDEGEIEV